MRAAWPIALGAVALGACAGSFTVTAALRSIRSEQSLTGRSHCDGCGAPLGFLQTVPVLSFAGLGGACAACGARIDAVHLAGEVIGGLVALVAVEAVAAPTSVILAALGLVLLASAVVDAKTQHLPDGLTVTAGALCAARVALEGGPSLALGVAIAAATFGVLEIARRAFMALRRRPGLGLGDVKLITALSIWLGTATPWAVLGASAAGLAWLAVWRPKDGKIAFGPMIAGAAWIIGLGREAHWWLSPN